MAKSTYNEPEVFPETIIVHGMTLTQSGRGDYPYDCPNRAKYPNDMIYRNHKCRVWDSYKGYLDYCKAVGKDPSG